MKKRLGFVSNSSSSSYITIGCGKLNIPNHNVWELNVPEDFGGKTEFGWGPEDLIDFGSRLNFCYAQILSVMGREEDVLLQKAKEAVGDNKHEWLVMLEDVLKNRLKVEVINWNLGGGYGDDGKVWCYIDHQSAASEGSNTEIFESVENMERFLFCEDSSIHLDNDNH